MLEYDVALVCKCTSVALVTNQMFNMIFLSVIFLKLIKFLIIEELDHGKSFYVTANRLINESHFALEICTIDGRKVTFLLF